MPILIPLLFTGAGVATGAYLEAKNKQEEVTLPQASHLLKTDPISLAMYATAGLGVYWLARKTGAIK